MEVIHSYMYVVFVFSAERPACVDCISVDRQRCVVVFSRSLTVRDVTETYAQTSATTVMLSLITNELVYRKIHYMFPGGRCVVRQSDCQRPNITSCVQSDWRSNFQQNLGITSVSNFNTFRLRTTCVSEACIGEIILS